MGRVDGAVHVVADGRQLDGQVRLDARHRHLGRAVAGARAVHRKLGRLADDGLRQALARQDHLHHQQQTPNPPQKKSS